MASDGNSEDESCVPRGLNEKVKIRKKILINQKNRITVFFQEFRGYCKSTTSNRKDELEMLFNELEQTLTCQEKEYLIKQWKPATEPIILVSTISQLQSIRSHLATRDLTQVTFAQQPQQPLDASLGSVYTNSSSSGQVQLSYYEGTDMVLSPNSQYSFGPGSESLTNGQISFISRTTLEEINHSDCYENNQNIEQNVAWPHEEEIPTDENVESKNEPNSVNSSMSVKGLFFKLCDIITNRGNFHETFSSAKRIYGKELCEDVMSYHDKDTEPLLFQLVMELDRYQSVLDMLVDEGLFQVNQRNVRNNSIFYYLLAKNVEMLYEFLKFTKTKKLQEKVRRICETDNPFMVLLEQKKEEANGHSIDLRKRLLSIATFCVEK